VELDGNSCSGQGMKIFFTEFLTIAYGVVTSPDGSLHIVWKLSEYGVYYFLFKKIKTI
jgi:hypothetical protein